jgi:hypothetical protein
MTERHETDGGSPHGTMIRTARARSSRPWWAPAGDAPRARLVRRIPRRIGQLLLTGIAVATLALSAVAVPGQQPVIRASGGIEAVPNLLDLSQGCGGVTTWPDAPAGETGWLDAGSEFTFLLNPPVSGNFAKHAWTGTMTLTESDTPLPHPAEALNLMYRGWIVVWYRTTADATTVKQLLDWARSLPADAHVLVSPWPLEQQMPWRSDRRIMITGWRTTQACLSFNARVLAAFDAKRVTAPGLGLADNALPPRATVSTTDRIRQAQSGQ